MDFAKYRAYDRFNFSFRTAITCDLTSDITITGMSPVRRCGVVSEKSGQFLAKHRAHSSHHRTHHIQELHPHESMFFLPRFRTVITSGLPQRLGARNNIGSVRVAGLHTTRIVQSDKKESKVHTTDSYAKEVDATPPPDATIHRVDGDSDRVQKPHEPPSGYSRSGVLHEEYRSVEKTEQPYSVKGGDKGSYGARQNRAEEQNSETSGSEDGPDAKSSGGRK